jgi:hypothetical protein
VRSVRAQLVDLPEPGDRNLPRYSSRPLPPYRYVPGLHPHPTRHPTGHSYQPSPTPNCHAPWSPGDWRDLDDWLYGVDLFNRFYFWEAHEAWEGLWAAAGPDGAAALLLQGLIQITAALLKTHMRAISGARTLAIQGLTRLHRSAMIRPTLLGLDLPATRERFERYLAPLNTGVLPVIGSDVPTLQLPLSSGPL